MTSPAAICDATSSASIRIGKPFSLYILFSDIYLMDYTQN